MQKTSILSKVYGYIAQKSPVPRVCGPFCKDARRVTTNDHPQPRGDVLFPLCPRKFQVQEVVTKIFEVHYEEAGMAQC